VRINLEGEPAGVVTAEQAGSAAKGLASRLLRRKARKAAAAAARAPCSGAAGGTVSVRPKRLGLADLKMTTLARRQ
jgi:sRNA-binding protein